MAVRYKRGPRPAGWAWKKIKFQDTKKNIYRFSATYDVSFSLRNRATPQWGIFMVHKFSSELMFSQTPDPPRFIVPTASNWLKMESRCVIQFSAHPVLSTATFMLQFSKYPMLFPATFMRYFSEHPVLSPATLILYLLTPWSRVLLEKLTSKLCS